jgi:hypothetical protein
MSKKFVFIFRFLICAVLIFLLMGCGTILYPKRIGQKGGNIDAGVAVMDGLCILLFVIPGIVAFIVDFSNGTIYLPGGGFGMPDKENAKKVSFDAGKCTIADIEKIVKNETGYEVSGPGTKIYSFSSMKELNIHFDALTQNAGVSVCSR